MEARTKSIDLFIGPCYGPIRFFQIREFDAILKHFNRSGFYGAEGGGGGFPPKRASVADLHACGRHRLPPFHAGLACNYLRPNGKTCHPPDFAQAHT